MTGPVGLTVEERLVRIPAGSVTIEGNLNLPEGIRAVVLFAHGSGSSRHSSRNRYVARVLNEAKLATLLIDLLPPTRSILAIVSATTSGNIARNARFVGVAAKPTLWNDHLRPGTTQDDRFAAGP